MMLDKQGLSETLNVRFLPYLGKLSLAPALSEKPLNLKFLIN